MFRSPYDSIIKTKYIINAVNRILPKQRNSKYTIEHLANHILDCNINYPSWALYGKHLRSLGSYPYYFHKYLNEIYNKWSNNDVFKEAYSDLLRDNYTFSDKNKCSLNTDVTCISNRCGVENIGLNPEYTKKHVTKLALLNTSDNVPISVHIIDNNMISDSYNTLKSEEVED